MNSLFDSIATAGISVGMGVLSIRGRDRGKVFIVVGLEGRRLILVNGGNRSLAKPKLKHYKHVKPLGHIMSEVEVNSIIRADIDCREKDTFLRKKIDLFLDKIKCEKEVSDAQRRSN